MWRKSPCAGVQVVQVILLTHRNISQQAVFGWAQAVTSRAPRQDRVALNVFVVRSRIAPHSTLASALLAREGNRTLILVVEKARGDARSALFWPQVTAQDTTTPFQFPTPGVGCVSVEPCSSDYFVEGALVFRIRFLSCPALSTPAVTYTYARCA